MGHGRGRLRQGVAAAGSCVALVVAVLLAWAPGSAQAQGQSTATTFVSNTGQSHDATLSGRARAQAFTTGTNAAGYTLTSVTFPMTGTIPSELKVQIMRSGSDNKPGDALGTLALARSGATVTGTTAGIDLTANTEYFVVLTGGYFIYGQGIHRTNSDSEDAGAAAGWSIADESLWDIPSWDNPSDTSWQIAIHGSAKATNSTPTLSGPFPDLGAAVGADLDYRFGTDTFADADIGTTLAFTATKADGTALPSWLTFDPSLRRFFGRPQSGDIGTVSVTLTASDGAASVSDTFDIKVANSSVQVSNAGQRADATSSFVYSRAQGFTTGSNAEGYTLTGVTFPVDGWYPGGLEARIERSDSNGHPAGSLGKLRLTQSGSTVTGTPPAGIALTPNTKYFVMVIGLSSYASDRLHLTDSGNEDAGGAAGWSIDNGSLLSLQKFSRGLYTTIFTDHQTWKVAVHGWAGGTNVAPRVARAIPDQLANIGATFSYAFPETAFADANKDALTYTATTAGGSVLPGWLTFDASTRTFSGTPQPGDAGTVSVTVTASDGTESISDTFDITVANSSVMVSNTGKRWEGHSILSYGRAQPFTTGPNAGGYTLTGVRFPVQGTIASGLELRIERSGSNGKPGGSLGTLKLGQNGSTVTAIAAEGIPLAANTTYFVVMRSRTYVDYGNYYTSTNSNAEDPGAAAGWSIGDHSFGGAPPWNGWLPQSWRLAILGSAVSDGIVPMLNSMEVNPDDGRIVKLKFDESLEGPNTQAQREMRFGFVVSGGYNQGVPVRNQSPKTVTVDGETVTLRLDTEVPAGKEASMRYNGRYALLRDPSGNAVEGFTASATRPGATPVLVEARAEGTTLTLTFNQDLDEDSAPAGHRFHVLHGSRYIWGTGTASVSGKRVTVTLASALPGHSNNVYYFSGDDSSPLRGASGGPEVADIWGFFPVVVLPEMVDSAAPVLSSGVVAGAKAVLYYDEALETGSTPAAGDFTVSAGGSGVSVSGVAVHLDAVVLTLGSSVAAGQSVTVTYTPGTNPVQDLAGNDAAALSGQALANRGPADAGKPALVAAAVADGTDDGRVLTLTFDTEIDPQSVPVPSTFSFSSQGPTSVESVAVRGNKVELGLTNWVFPCAPSFSVSYTKPAAGALANLWGTEADEFVDQAVTNPQSLCETTWLSGTRLGSVILIGARPFATDVALRPEWFTVTASGGPVTVTAAEFSPEDARELRLSLSRELAEDETVTVSYRRPSGHPGLWDAAGNQLADLIDAPVDTSPSTPTVTAVAVVSDPRGGDTYARGEVIRVRVTFSEAVEVTGVPTLTIDMDPAYWGAKQATYVSGTGTAELVFAHEVVRPNYSTQGIAVIGDSLALAGGLIRSVSYGEDAELAHDGLEHDASHKVDWHLDPLPAEDPVGEPGVNRAPVYGGEEAVILRNALPAYLVSLPLSKDDFSDPDGDDLTFTMTVDRDDVHVPHGLRYIPSVGRVGYVAKNSCALADLGPLEADAFYTVVTMTATDPDGASASATATFRTDPAAGACPALSTATVNGATVTLVFDDDLVSSWIFTADSPQSRMAEIAASHFTVTVDGTAVTLADTDDAVAFDTDAYGDADGDTITLTLAEPVTSSQVVTVSYDPGDNPRAAPFEDQAATNNTPAPAQEPETPKEPQQPEEPQEPETPKEPQQPAQEPEEEPETLPKKEPEQEPEEPEGPATLISAAVDGSDLILTFSRDLAPVSGAAARNLIFAFLIEGARDSFGTPVSQSPNQVAVNGATITLTLGTPITAGNDATITYWGTTLQQADGTRLPGFTTTLTTATTQSP